MMYHLVIKVTWLEHRSDISTGDKTNVAWNIGVMYHLVIKVTWHGTSE